MVTGRHARFAGLFIGICLSGLGHAQTMYRCGNVYQDRPCDGGQQGKVIGSTGSQQSAHTPVADAECAQRGANTLKIVWAREAGASAEKQIADIDARRPALPRSWEEKRLVKDVFNKRGSAPEVRAAIEADCMLEKEKAAQAAATAAAAEFPSRTSQPEPATIPIRNYEVDTKAADTRRDDYEAQERARKKSHCDDLKARMVDVRNSQRSGGNVQEMERLNRRSRETEAQLRNASC
jgi:hypothetical protein